MIERSTQNSLSPTVNLIRSGVSGSGLSGAERKETRSLDVAVEPALLAVSELELVRQRKGAYEESLSSIARLKVTKRFGIGYVGRESEIRGGVTDRRLKRGGMK